MLRFTTRLVALVCISLPAIGFAKIDQQTMKNRMVNDLEIIRNCFEINYAPLDWKKTYAQWTLHQAISMAQVQVLASEKMTIKKFQSIVKKFFKSTRDYHVAVEFCRTSYAYLPFRIRGAEGRYFITSVDDDAPKSLSVGDEILTFNGKPIQAAIDEVKERELGNIGSKTDQTLAEIFLTTRVGSIGHEVPTGPVSITTKSRLFYYEKEDEDNFLVQYDFEWISTPEEVTDGPYAQALECVLAPKKVNLTQLSANDYFCKKMVAGFDKSFTKAFEHVQADGKPLGYSKSKMPPLGRVTWESDEEARFHAYIAETPKGHTIGYVRLPTYSDTANSAKEFSQLINKFQESCEALVIDQQDNSGGLVFYMYAIASMLSDAPLNVPPHRMTITQNDAFLALLILEILNSEDIGKLLDGLTFDDTIFGYPITKDLIQQLIVHFNFILQEWNTGNTLTSLGSFYGIDTLKPHPWGTFNKPIVVLVNELDFSCADFLPAILQDNKRATILGTRTAGAGGSVMETTFSNRFGISSFRLTSSIAERPDKKPIENLGVTPDIQCDVSMNDLRCGYVDYCSKVQNAVDALLQK